MSLGTTNVLAQKKIGVYIHGFQGGSEKWTDESLAPQNMIGSNGVLDGYVALDYETLDLDGTNRNAFLQKMINQIRNNTCVYDPTFTDNDYNCRPEIQFIGNNELNNNTYILFGHSLGGLVARVFYRELKTYTNMNIKGIINIGGPVQGSGAVEVDRSRIEYLFGVMEERFEDAWAVRSPLVNAFVFRWSGENTITQLDSVPEYLVQVRDSALGYVDHIIETNAADLIGRDGHIISLINVNMDKNDINEHPENYLSIIGAEKELIPVRIAGHIYSDVEDLQSEQNSINEYNNFLGYFNGHITAYNLEYITQKASYIACLSTLGLFHGASCRQIRDRRDRAEERREIWKDAKIEAENIDTYWGELIDSYWLEPFSYQEYIPPCPEDGEIPGPMLNLQIPTPINCSPNPFGEWVTRTAYIKHADKSDGVVNTESVLWNEGDSFNDLNNRYFDDLGEEGGYNHFELRNYKRGYDLERSDGSYVFRKGDIAPQFVFMRAWISDLDN
jgi:pimeloyl-ACP methyl ester carboxylesterase